MKDSIEQAIDMILEQDGDWILVGWFGGRHGEVFEPLPIVDLQGPLTKEQFKKEVYKYLKQPRTDPNYGPYAPHPPGTEEPWWLLFPSAGGAMEASNDDNCHFIAGPRKYVMGAYNSAKKGEEPDPSLWDDYELLFPVEKKPYYKKSAKLGTLDQAKAMWAWDDGSEDLEQNARNYANYFGGEYGQFHSGQINRPTADHIKAIQTIWPGIPDDAAEELWVQAKRLYKQKKV